MESTPIVEATQKKTNGLTCIVLTIVSIFTTAVILIIVLFASSVIRFVGVNGSSMEPTLSDNDRLITVKQSSYEYGDIVAFNVAFNEPVVKRVIAKGGQTIDINFESGDVFVDDEKLNEPYIKELTHESAGISFPLTVPEGTLFLMGDNRNNSADSRSNLVGCVDERYVLGKAVFRILPLGSFDIYKNFNPGE